MSTDSNTRKPVPKKKMYGKNVKSHLSGWFGRDLWSQVEPDVAPRKKKDTDKRQPTIRSETSRKQLVETEERSSTDADTSSGVRAPPTQGIPVTKDIEEVKVSDSPVEFRDLEAEIDAVLESMEKLDVQSLDGRAETGAPITVDLTSEYYEPLSESTNPHSPAKSLKENSDKENEEPPSSPPSSPLRQGRTNSRGRPPASSEALPREALRERSLSPDAGDVFESPARRNGLRKRARGSIISIHSPVLSSPHRKETKRASEYQGDCGEVGDPIMVWEDEGAEGVIRVGPLVNLLGRKASRLENIEIPDSEDEGDTEDVIQPIAEPTTLQRGKPPLVQEEHKKGFAVVIDSGKVPLVVDSVSTEPVPVGDTVSLDATREQPPIDQLLRYCSEPSILNFEDYINHLLESCSIRKLGEASYSEVFLQSTPNSSTTVLKVIPFGGFGQCRLGNIIQEIRITKALGGIEGFVGFRGAYAVQGRFPQALMDEWDCYDEKRGSENVRPDFYEGDQMFAIICLENGGVDLEHFELNGWEEAWEVFWQVTLALARGEKERNFEHRDLHCGNIVIRRLSDEGFPEDLLSKLSLQGSEPEQGPGRSQPRLKVALIDYTLSRANCGEDQSSDPGTEFAPLDDDALFGGKGNYQFDVYRFMRNHLSSGLVDPSEEWIDWNVYAPRTNVFWLHYLTNMLLTEKKIPRPAARGRNAATEAQKKCYKGLEAIARTLDPRRKKFGKDHVDLGSAGEVVEWAVEQGIWEGRAPALFDS